MEEWRAVEGYEGYYEVSNLGRVKALARDVLKSNGVIQHRNEYIKAQTVNPDGYLIVGLNKDAKQRKQPVHVLVAKAFVDGWFDGAEVNHIDFDRTNNSADNLEWVSHSTNIAYSYDNDRHEKRRQKMMGSGNQNYGNDTLHKRYMNDKEFAKLKQSRPGSQNGRAMPVIAHFSDGNSMSFSYCGECAQYLIDNGLVRGTKRLGVAAHIISAAKNGVPYFGMTFELI